MNSISKSFPLNCKSWRWRIVKCLFLAFLTESINNKGTNRVDFRAKDAHSCWFDYAEQSGSRVYIYSSWPSPYRNDFAVSWVSFYEQVSGLSWNDVGVGFADTFWRGRYYVSLEDPSKFALLSVGFGNQPLAYYFVTFFGFGAWRQPIQSLAHFMIWTKCQVGRFFVLLLGWAD